MCKIHIGGREHEYLSIEILNRESPDSESPDYWEKNWLHSIVEVRVGAFSGSVSANFQAEDFVRIREQLRDLLGWKENDAEFGTLEGWLTARFMMDDRGGITVLGDLVDRPMDGNRLRFQFAID